MVFMGSRSDWLTDFAKPVADDLAARSGSLKHVLSAGVMALAGCTAELREYYMARAMGAEIDPQAEEARIARMLVNILQGGNYNLNPEEITFLEGARRIFAEDIAASPKKEAGRRTRARHV